MGPDPDGALWIGFDGEPTTYQVQPIGNEPESGELVLYIDCAAGDLKEARAPQPEAFGIPVGRVVAVHTLTAAGMRMTEAELAERRS